MLFVSWRSFLSLADVDWGEAEDDWLTAGEVWTCDCAADENEIRLKNMKDAMVRGTKFIDKYFS